MTANRRLLVSVAHPDDESFGLGGLVARYVAEGVDVYLICATNGDVGTVSPEMLNGYRSVAELRLAELDCAVSKLGFKQVFKLGYKDSGMLSSPTVHDPDCLWQQWETNPQAVTRRVVEIVREVRPQVVITFNRYGGYGHPDHIAIQRATTEAFHQVGDPAYNTGGQPPYSPQKLYYTGISAGLLRFFLTIMKLRGKDPRKFGRNQDIDAQAILDHVEPVHTKVDIRDYYRAWDAAAACHASQGGGRGGIIPRWARRWLIPHVGLTRVHPAPSDSRVDERDLFAGMQADERVTDAMP